MPKEIIKCHGYDIEVRWGRDSGIAQLATVMPEPQTSEAPQNLPQLIETWGDHDRDPETSLARGLFANISRREINDLIRVLRRARDQTYGRDE